MSTRRSNSAAIPVNFFSRRSVIENVGPQWSGSPKTTPWNANVKVRPFEFARVTPYVTAGAGASMADAIVNRSDVGTLTIEDRRRLTDLATNVGAGVTYRLTDWMGLSADYRSFFVHRDEQTPRVDRLTTGVTFAIK